MRVRFPLVAAVVLVTLPMAARAQATTTSDTVRTIISATGQARASLTPDRVTLNILVEPQAMSPAEAGSRLASVERAVLDTLRHFNLPASAIQTVNGGIAPYRSNMSPASGPSFTGRTSIRVELTRLDMLPALTGAVLAKGATFVSPAFFTFSGADSVRRALIPQAFQAARREAQTLAAAAGGSVGRLLDLSAGMSPSSMSEQVQSVYFSGMMYDNGQRIAPVTSVIVNVTTRWLLVGPR
jgi:uncharacterized protein YggE